VAKVLDSEMQPILIAFLVKPKEFKDKKISIYLRKDMEIQVWLLEVLLPSLNIILTY
jgi:hypothetical protein